MRLFDNDATASLTDRERALLEMLGRCEHYLAALAGSRYISGDDPASADMRQRAAGLQRAAFNLIDSDDATRRAMYAEG
jgi:hypothetical protein